MSKRIYYTEFKKALLGNREFRVIGNFVLVKAESGVAIFSKEAYELWKVGEQNRILGKEKPWIELHSKKKIDHENKWKAEPITDEELSLIE